jgi:hypothetical protein
VTKNLKVKIADWGLCSTSTSLSLTHIHPNVVSILDIISTSYKTPFASSPSQPPPFL